jgi:S-DNA-T family DNA segregation ATPase FtsK/SpoIIIE
MARKDNTDAPHARGFGDIIGLALIASALLLMISQWSFDRYDISDVRVPANNPAHNPIGSAGAWVAFASFRLMGAAAFILPAFFVFFGMAYLWDFMAYLRQRWYSWLAALVVLVCCMGMLDLYTNSALMNSASLNPNAGFLERLSFNIATPSAGGMGGKLLNQAIFNSFGTMGATIIFVVLYIISFYFLTNFELGNWLRAALAKPDEDEAAFAGMTPEEKALARKARDLEKQAKKLQAELDKSSNKGKEAEKGKGNVEVLDENGKPKVELGADLQPVPEPTIRDLSVWQSKTAPKGRGKAEDKGILEGEVITAEEIRAATTEDILGKAGAKTLKAGKESPETSGKPTEDKDKKAGTEAKLEKQEDKADMPESDNPFAVKTEEEKKAEAVAPPVVPPKPRVIMPRKPKPIAVAATPKIGNYQLPSMDFLQMPEVAVLPAQPKEELMANAVLMKNTLAQFDIEVSIGDITKGPTITRYELHPAPGVKLEKITALSNNIAAALKAERIHILAPVPGKSSVGVEVPNAIKTKVIMRDLLESDEWHNTKARIPIALGKDVYGHPIIADLADMPHLLIAGSTGSGKSVCINAVVGSLLYRFRPDEMRFVMIDPKVVELQHYNVLPHLVVPVVTDPKKVILALRWVVNEMEKRYKIFAKVGVRNIKSFNDRPRNKPLPPPEPELPLFSKKEKVEAGSDGFAVEVDEEIVVPREDDIVIPDRLSYIVVIIDELADLMLVAPADVEMAIARITQMARAAGIHCIVATQRPSVDVITGVIKSNIPARIAFQVASQIDSRTILDAKGADKLLGKGDMLYLPPGSAKLIRAQGVLITDQEIQSVVDFIAKQGKPSYELEIHEQLQKPVSSLDGEETSNEDEALIEQCIEVIRSEQKASVSLLQRRLKLGYGRAARIMDELERRGVVGPSKGAEPRDILIDLDGTGMDGVGVDTSAGPEDQH